MGGWKTWIVAGVAVAMLASCGDEGGGGGGGGPRGPVDGRVMNGSRQPVLGAVVVLGKDYANPSVTDAFGAFHFDEVPSAYDLTVIEGDDLLEVHGLTRRDPMLVKGNVGFAPRYARVVGGVTGATLPLAGDESVRLGLTGAAFNPTETYADGTFDTALSWFGPAHWEGDLVAVHVRKKADKTLDFLAAGRQALVLDEDKEVSDVAVELTTVPVETSTTTLSFDASGDPPTVGTLSFTVMGARFAWLQEMEITDGAEITLPSEGGSLYLSRKLGDGTTLTLVRKAVLDGTTQFDIPAFAALEAVLPEEAATGVSSTPTLQWTPVSGADLFLVWMSNAGRFYTYVLPAGTTKLEIPDYGELGRGLQPGSGVSWSVRAVDIDGLTPDEATNPAGEGIGVHRLSTLDEALLLETSESNFFVDSPVPF